jgi:AcrR family transcriptional regulator
MSSAIPARDRIVAAAKELFGEHGFADVTTLEIATRAGVSKRELYALVGNKQALLAAAISERGARMRLPDDYPKPESREALRAALHIFGATMIRELTDPDVVAVFRLGIAQSKRSPMIARSIQERGREPARQALGGLLRAARASKLIVEGDLAQMTSHFNALLWGDLMVWLLLGLEKAPAPKEVERRSAEATTLFLSLYGRP